VAAAILSAMGKLGRILVISVSFLLVSAFVFSTVVEALPVKAQQGRKTASAAREKAKKKLEEAKLRVCNRKETIIKNRSERLAGRAERIMNRFDRIVERVDEFYDNRLVPQGGTIQNYDQILAGIDAKKDAVEKAVEEAKEVAENFDCAGDDPKGQLQTFREEMQGVIRALKEYRKSVIDYLVTVVTKAKNFKAATGSATPSANN
jgi:hypothetical protein